MTDSSSIAIEGLTGRANAAARQMAEADTTSKNEALLRMARLVGENREELIKANRDDMERAEGQGLPSALVNRLVFNEKKIDGRITSLEKIARLRDPVGQFRKIQRTDNGLLAGRMNVPLGVILMIYEARPHVTVNAGAFALKSGNAIICKGGSEAASCNGLLAGLWVCALGGAGLPPEAVQVVSLSHEDVDALLERSEDIDLVIPRGGKKLIETVAEKSRIPVIKHYEGVCNIYVGPDADTEKARKIILDSKLLMPAVCNAAETVLVDETMRPWLPELGEVLREHGVEIRGDEAVQEAIPDAKAASEEDWATEYLDKIYSVRVVGGPSEAIDHIAAFGSGHTDVIVTENYSIAERFLRQVDSSVVLVNASTMFCDGESLGMGAEIGISTDKLHARGPMGLEDLTTYKHVIRGEGQVMGDF
jgi:glutamate-5-semialdehyde dehydrogenase